MLPETLWCLLNAVLVLAQTRQQLPLNTFSLFNNTNIPNPPSFTIPASDSKLSISVALCSTLSSFPRFFISNSSDNANPDSSGGKDVYEISVADGMGQFIGPFPSGGVLAVENAGAAPFEIGLSDTENIHQLLESSPLLGDTTSTQVLLFSPPFSPPEIVKPTYPNYTLPQANLSQPPPPQNPPNFTLVISTAALPQSACLIRNQTSLGTITSQTLWLRDDQGWRTQWIVDGLAPQTNYTAYVIQDDTKVAGPIFFLTKSPLFTCPLVSSLPYCPGVSYAVPLPALQPPSASFYNASTVPDAMSQPIIEYLTNFTTTLTTFACGRDEYSPIMGCDDCQKAYRKWLCLVSFLRCGEAAPTSSTTSTSVPTGDAQAPLSAALTPQIPSNPPRNTALPPHPEAYWQLLPCIETCTAVDRACPNFLGFRCPKSQFGAQRSYGVGYIDGFDDGSEGAGTAGSNQDVWGNVWCNA